MPHTGEVVPLYERIQRAVFGVLFALLSFGYGLYSLVFAKCVLAGKGNPPWGTFVTFYGTEARLLSAIFIGAGIWTYAAQILIHRNEQLGVKLSWFGASTTVFGCICLIGILLRPVLGAYI